jgi:dihydrofolate reductase
MRKLMFSMNISLDGYADHTVAIADDELHEFASDLLDSVDILLFGRVTYQLMESYWPIARSDPSATQSMMEFADRINAKPKVVFSRTLRKAVWNDTRLVKDGMVEEVMKLKQQPGRNLALGGISICQEFMRLGLVDEYWLLVQPIIVGKGRRLFEGLRKRIDLKLVGTKTFGSGVVVLHYRADKG